MPRLRFLWVLLLVSSLVAVGQTFQVTPGSLAGWTVAGAKPAELSSGQVLSLPSGTLLYRSFATPELFVSLVTQPVFGVEPENWPILATGPAVVAFIRSGTEGRLILAIGENAEYDLPFTFALDANGRSLSTLGLRLALNGSMVEVESSGQTVRYPLDRGSYPPLEVTVSSGQDAAWSLTNFTVTVFPVRSSASDVIPKTAETAGTALLGQLKTRHVEAVDKTEGAGSQAMAGGTYVIAAPVPATLPASAGTLEVFTPPSVRHIRAEQLRRIGSNAAKL